MQDSASLLHITFRTPEPEILIGLLSAFPSEGLQEDTDRVIWYVTGETWDSLHDEVQQLVSGIAQIESIDTLPEQNWNKVWEASFRPVMIDDFCAVRASFHAPLGTCQYELIIDPRMAFGTAHHETTQLVIRAMRTLDIADKDILDLGCGTGILAILAMQMGVSSATAVDNDPEAVANAIDNAMVNNVHLRCMTGTLDMLTGKQFNIILANIDRNVLLQIIPQMPEYLTPGGCIVLSGILTTDVDLIMRAINEAQMKVTRQEVLGEWACLKCIGQ